MHTQLGLPGGRSAPVLRYPWLVPRTCYMHSTPCANAGNAYVHAAALAMGKSAPGHRPTWLVPRSRQFHKPGLPFDNARASFGAHRCNLVPPLPFTMKSLSGCCWHPICSRVYNTTLNLGEERTTQKQSAHWRQASYLCCSLCLYSGIWKPAC